VRITKKQLRQVIREAVEENELLGLTGPWHEVVAAYIARGPGNGSQSATNMVLNKLHMGPDLWRMQEDVLEDMLIELGPNATPEQIDAVSIEFRDGVRANKWMPQTKEEMEADWARGGKPRADYS
tara:strand:- start:4872 stop:5246 length:375 start_codon:yes stop_codon:yes gene_type:complete